MARTKNSKITDKVDKSNVEKNDIIDPMMNIETIETELKEEYKEETIATEEAMANKEPELSIEANVELLKEYSDTNKKMEEIMNATDSTTVEKNVVEELKKVDGIKEELTKAIADAEKELTDKQKEIVDKAVKGRNFSGFWNGVSYNW